MWLRIESLAMYSIYHIYELLKMQEAKYCEIHV